jgi:hypothetical protein
VRTPYPLCRQYSKLFSNRLSCISGTLAVPSSCVTTPRPYSPLTSRTGAGDVTLGELHLDLVPFDDDLLSLEAPGSFRSVLVPWALKIARVLR